MPRNLPRDLGVGAACGECVEFREFGGLRHVAFKLAAVIREGKRGFVRHRIGWDQVDPPQFVRRDAPLPGRDVDQAFDGIGRFRPAGSAIGGGGDGVGKDSAHLGRDRGNDVGAGDASDIADWPTGAAGAIRTQIGVPAQLQCGDFVVRIKAELRDDAHFARLFIGQKAFGAVADPAYWAV